MAIGTFEEEVGNAAATSVIARHAGLIITLGYAFLAAVGMMYNFFYFGFFGINVLEYSETSDFIVAAVRSPMVVMLCILPAALLRLGISLRRFARRHSPRYDAYARRHETQYGRQWRAVAFVLVPLSYIVYAAAFTANYAAYSSNKVKQGIGKHVHVTRTTPVPADSSAKLIVGTTAKFFFFYDSLTKSTDAIPVDNIAAITVPLVSRKAAP